MADAVYHARMAACPLEDEVGVCLGKVDAVLAGITLHILFHIGECKRRQTPGLVDKEFADADCER